MKIRYQFSDVKTFLKPYGGIQYKCALFNAYRKTGSAKLVLSNLLSAIDNKMVKPFFVKDEIQELFRDEVLHEYGNGRYLDGGPKTLADWTELLGNLAMPPLFNRRALVSGRYVTTLEEGVVLAHSMMLEIRRLKIVEDWIYHNPKVQELLAELISS